MQQYIYGKNIVFDKLKKKDSDIVEIFESGKRHQNIIDIAKQQNINVKIIDQAKMDKQFKGNHQGVVAHVLSYEYAQLSDIIIDKPDATILMLDQVEDPHNFGAIIRSAAAVGVDGIVILDRRAVGVTPTVIKTAAGAIDNVKIVKVNNLKRAMETLKDAGYWIVGSDLRDAVAYTDINYNMKTVLIMGSEGKGMSRLVREGCDYIAKIPIVNDVESLNVSVATGVLLYEILRQRTQK
ncbi:MAG: 23S rRNA (guanosine(2251)-2'-O)-methyltransferase RlmB [Erysipelothrix sp.]|nr:23S rRNA (guanosine(2251)-2'-O)-methyltransferase RlmB [Erysipelothrix sp.]